MYYGKIVGAYYVKVYIYISVEIRRVWIVLYFIREQHKDNIIESPQRKTGSLAHVFVHAMLNQIPNTTQSRRLLLVCFYFLHSNKKINVF